MAMKMLQAGGMPLLIDGARAPDESNLEGYFEFEPVKGLDKPGGQAWLGQAHGRAVKVISWLVTWLPETYDYRVIYMQRDLDEVIASQHAMLIRRGQPGHHEDQAAMRQIYAEHVEQAGRFLQRRRCFASLSVDYRDVLDRPAGEAQRIADFVQRPLDIAGMAAAVNPALHHSRGGKTRQGGA